MKLSAFVLLSMMVSSVAFAQTVTFKPKAGVQTFAVREPVLKVKPGTTIETETFSQPGDYYDRDGGPWPGEVGPIYVEGAAPGDTVVVKIVKLQTNRDTAVSAIRPAGLSALATDGRLRLLNDPLPSRRFVWRLDNAKGIATLDLPNSRSKQIEIPLQPMLGRVAVAPSGQEAFGGLWPGAFGGNMDVPDVRQGATVYLPVFHEGALLYFGDVHAAQGDGEVCGSGLETTATVTLQVDLIKGKRIAWPRIEDADHIMVAGSARPLIDAFRIAHVELIDWLVAEYGFERLEAYQVVSQVGTARIGNVVDPLYTVAAKFPKKLLPPR